MNSEQNTTMARVPDDHPLMVAWNEYKALPDYANTKKWATVPAHTEGSLWAAFMAGWYKARALEQREGFVMVPVEPTPEMVNAACAIKLRRLNELAAGKDGNGIEAGIREDYSAMLAAAPKPEGSGHG